MGQLDSDDLSQLLPDLQQRAQAASPANTAALRAYMKVLGEKPANVPIASSVHAKPRTDGLALRDGSGRRPPRRYFTIKLGSALEDQPEEPATAAPTVEEEALDPDALKDALVEQAQAQRRALLEAGRRLGTGRVPRHREFAINLPPPQVEAEDAVDVTTAAVAAEAEAEVAEQEASVAGLAEQQEQFDEQQGEAEHWEGLEAEEGVLAEHWAAQAVRLADAVTPGAALRLSSLQQAEAEQRGSCEGEAADALPAPLEPGSTQQGQARTPGTSLVGRYTPMEGVPERLALLATRGKGVAGRTPAGPASGGAAWQGRPAATPAGFTPLEGIPERLLPFRPLLGATRLGSNSGRRPSVDSPVEGLVQEGAARRRGSSSLAAACPAEAGGRADFRGFEPSPSATAAAAPPAPSPRALPEPAALLHQDQEQQAPAAEAIAADGGANDMGYDDDDDDLGGGFDDGGCYDEEPPAAGHGSGPALADAGIQTGASMDAEASPAAGTDMPLAHDEYDDYDGGFDADDHAGDEYENEELPETTAAALRARRQTKNPGARLRNELKRKSLAADPRIGRQEVLPGVRRSSRQKQEPLKWWLNERKEFGRRHKTMPTVNNVVHKVPNTPWQTVTDIKRRPSKKARAPTPHALEDALAVEAGLHDEEEQEEEERDQQDCEDFEDDVQGGAAERQAEGSGDDEEQQPRQQRRPGSGGRRALAQRQQRQAGSKQAQEAAKQPAVRGKATKKAAAAGSKRRKTRR